MFLHNRISIRRVFTKWEQNYITKLQRLIINILMSWFKIFDSKHKNTESTERQKTIFPKEIVENADQHKLYQTK